MTNGRSVCSSFFILLALNVLMSNVDVKESSVDGVSSSYEKTRSEMIKAAEVSWVGFALVVIVSFLNSLDM